MAIRNRTSDEPDLRPVRWPGPPRGFAALRTLLVTALLAVAVGLLYLDRPVTECAGPGARSTRAVQATASAKAPEAPGPDGTKARAVVTPAGPATSSADRTGDGQLPLPAGTVGVAIRLAEPAALHVVRPGVRVDLLALQRGAEEGTAPALLAGRALVLGVAGGDEAAALYLALAPEAARRAVSMPEETRFAIMVRS